MYDQIVKTQTISVSDVPCNDGRDRFSQVTFDWEEYGSAKLADGSDKPVVLILPFFLGSARAAGHSGFDEVTRKYKSVGYWDGLIGPRAPIDTDTHRVISFGPLINAKCAPSSINPATGKPYGSAFPHFSFRDYAAIHRQALSQLGVDRIDLLAGASMGSLQAWHLMAQDFTKVGRMLLVVPSGLMLPQKTRALAAKWVGELEGDPAWNKGDYYDPSNQAKPTVLAKVLAEFWYRCQFPMDTAMVYEPDQEAWAAALADLKLLLPGVGTDAKVLSDVIEGQKDSRDPRIQRFFGQVKTLSKITDHNTLLWQLRTIGTFGAREALQQTDDLRFGWMGDQPIDETQPNRQVMPQVLIVYSPGDDLFTEKEVLDTQKAPLGLGQNVKVVALNSAAPHADGLGSEALYPLNVLILDWLGRGSVPQKPSKL